MNNFENELLNDLLNKYENSKLSKEGTKNNRNIKLTTKDKCLKTYIGLDSYKYVEENNAIIKKLEEKGFIKTYFNNDTFEYLILNLENVDSIYDYLKRDKPKDELENIKKILNSYKFSNFLNDFIEYSLTYINSKYSYPKIYFKDSKELDLILKSFSYIFSLEEGIKKRDFSVKYLKDSKLFESIENKIIKIINDFDEFDYLNDEDVLANYGIIKNSSYALIKNGIKFKINNQIINLNDLKFEFSLSDEMIKNLEILNINSNKIITVENLTSFYSLNEEDSTIIYLAGFHNHTKAALLKKIYEKYPNLTYYHFSDIDVGGFLIFMNLKNKTKIPFIPYKMSINELINNKNNLKTLTENDKKRLLKLKENKEFNVFKDVIDYMLLNNCKLEQEILD